MVCVVYVGEEDPLGPGTLRHRKPKLLSHPQIVRTFRIETRKASKAVARRKVRPCSSCLGGYPRADSEELRLLFPSTFILEIEFDSFTYFVGGELRLRVFALSGDPQNSRGRIG